MENCIKCGIPNGDDRLTADGLCFTCDQGSHEAAPSSVHARELGESIAHGLARKLGTSFKTARTRLGEAVADWKKTPAA